MVVVLAHEDGQDGLAGASPPPGDDGHPLRELPLGLLLFMVVLQVVPLGAVGQQRVAASEAPVLQALSQYVSLQAFEEAYDGRDLLRHGGSGQGHPCPSWPTQPNRETTKYLRAGVPAAGE